MEKDGLLLFVEVKGRSGEWETSAWAPSWRGKSRRMRGAIGVYLQAHPEMDYREIRIEIVFVTPTRVVACYEGI
jgi:Holliday junction resolvase-like predicted endonuclease